MPSEPAPWTRLFVTWLPPPYWTRMPAFALAETVTPETVFPEPHETTPTPTGLAAAETELPVSVLPSACR
jgi:hypothetical protein